MLIIIVALFGLCWLPINSGKISLIFETISVFEILLNMTGSVLNQLLNSVLKL